MSFAKVNAAVAEVIAATKVAVYEKMRAFLEEKLDEESLEAMRELFDEFKTTLDADIEEEKKEAKAVTKGKNGKAAKTGDGEPKVKKAPSAYNIFVGETIKKVRAENPGLSAKEAMGMMKELWAKHKEENGIVSKTSWSRK